MLKYYMSKNIKWIFAKVPLFILNIKENDQELPFEISIK